MCVCGGEGGCVYVGGFWDEWVSVVMCVGGGVGGCMYSLGV